MLELNKVYCMDNVLGMSQLNDNIVDLTVTSPPYDNLRDYNKFSWNFNEVAKQLFRITKNGGIVVWVVNDETRNFCETLSSFKQSIYFVEECGFKQLDTMIYHKSNYARISIINEIC